MLQFSLQAQERAKRAWRCSPFRQGLFDELRQRGVSLAQIVGPQGYQAGYTVKPLPELRADTELMWLIQVGVLRREVDGQGITDSYRLAPLGQQILAQSSAQGQLSSPTWGERIQNHLTRWGLW